MADTSTVEQQQDALRPLRQFVGLLTTVANDQSWAYQDSYAYNQPYQYQVIGATGSAIEGQPIATTASGGLVLSNGLIMLALGAALVYALVK